MAKIVDIKKAKVLPSGRTETRADISYSNMEFVIASYRAGDLGKDEPPRQSMQFDKKMAKVLYDYLGYFLGINK
jgi:hypothetical protein